MLIQENERQYQLVSAKVEQEYSGLPLRAKVRAHLIYSLVEELRLSPSVLEKKISGIAVFASLRPHKVVAQLEQFQSCGRVSEEHLGTYCVPVSDVCKIEGQGKKGCSFILENYLADLLGGDKVANQCLAIQVHLYVPSTTGITKGTLLRKRITDGPQIKITPLM